MPRHGRLAKTSTHVYTRRGPNRSTSIPMPTRAGIVSARLHSSRTCDCSFVRCNTRAIVVLNAPRLYQTTNVRKNDTHARCNIRQRAGSPLGCKSSAWDRGDDDERIGDTKKLLPAQTVFSW